MLRMIRKAMMDYEATMLVVMFIFVAAFIIDVWDNPRAGRLFPFYVGLITLALLTIEAVITFRKRALMGPAPSPTEMAKKTTPLEARNIVEKFVLLVFLYYLAILAIGYLYASFFFLVIAMWMLGVRKKIMILAIAVGTLAAVYAVFVWGFTFMLPSGKLF